MARQGTMLPVPGDNPQGGHDARPLPLIVADKWQFPLQHHDTDDGVMYAIQDWIAGLATTSTRTSAQLWTDMKADVSASIQPLRYTAKDNKTYKRDFTDDKGLYLIAQHMRVTAKRPALRAIQNYLAAAGVFADEVRRDPDTGVQAAIDAYRAQGKDDAWIEARLEGKVSRANFVTALKNAIFEMWEGKYFGIATNEVYIGLWRRTARQLREEMGLPKSANLRDHQHAITLKYLAICEQTIAMVLPERPMVTWDEARVTVASIANIIGDQARQTGELLNMDLATGKPLLTTGRRPLLPWETEDTPDAEDGAEDEPEEL